jgi:hypothetical protein
VKAAGAAGSLLRRLRERGVLRTAASYAVISWLLLQIADVTFEPLGVPRWVMAALIVTAVLGLPAVVARIDAQRHDLQRMRATGLVPARR